MVCQGNICSDPYDCGYKSRRWRESAPLGQFIAFMSLSQTTSFSLLSIFNDRYSINYYMHTITTACLSSYQSQRIMHPQHVHFNNNTFKTSSFVMHNLKKGIVEQLAELLSLSTRDPGSNLLRCCLC